MNHHRPIPDLNSVGLGKLVYQTSPWLVYQNDQNWVYLNVGPEISHPVAQHMLVLDKAFSRLDIYNPDLDFTQTTGFHALSFSPTDQIWLAPFLAIRQGCIFHAAGMVIGGQGFLFVGHSGAGKSTAVTLLEKEGEILCDDRIALRRTPEGFRIYGTWSHGDVPDVSPSSAPLRAILFLEQSGDNRLIPLTDRKDAVRRLPFFFVKPLVTADWWNSALDLVGDLAREAPLYRLQFDKSGQVADVVRSLVD